MKRFRTTACGGFFVGVLLWIFAAGGGAGALVALSELEQHLYIHPIYPCFTLFAVSVLVVMHDAGSKGDIGMFLNPIISFSVDIFSAAFGLSLCFFGISLLGQLQDVPVNQPGPYLVCATLYVICAAIGGFGSEVIDMGQKPTHNQKRFFISFIFIGFFSFLGVACKDPYPSASLYSGISNLIAFLWVARFG